MALLIPARCHAAWLLTAALTLLAACGGSSPDFGPSDPIAMSLDVGEAWTVAGATSWPGLVVGDHPTGAGDGVAFLAFDLASVCPCLLERVTLVVELAAVQGVPFEKRGDVVLDVVDPDDDLAYQSGVLDAESLASAPALLEGVAVLADASATGELRVDLTQATVQLVRNAPGQLLLRARFRGAADGDDVDDFVELVSASPAAPHLDVVYRIPGY